MTDSSSNAGMPGLEHVQWADAEIAALTVNYDAIEIRLDESTGNSRTVLCAGHIGCRFVGFWDEVVVEGAEIVEHDPFIDDCVGSLATRLGRKLPESGNPHRNMGRWSMLRVTLSDGVTIDVVAAHFSAL